MRVLGIETSGEVASLAVLNDDGLLAELSFRHRQQLSRDLVPAVESLLARVGLEVADLDGLAVGLGPGSFTGLRLGVTAAKSLAYAAELPVAGIGTLPALAAEHPAPARLLLCTVVPASATQVFAALFQWENGRPVARAEELLLPADELAERLESTPLEVLVVGDPGPLREPVVRALGPRATFGGGPTPRAATVARLGRDRLLEGSADPVHALAPRYLRPSAAEARRGTAACLPS